MRDIFRKKHSDRNGRVSESFLLGSLLAVTGGYLDAYTYVSRGGVFANAQTGNIILMGLNAADGKLVKAFNYLLPILAFVAGIILVERIKELGSRDSRLHWKQVILLAEAAVLFLVGFLPGGPMNMLANLAISFVCSMQVESFRKLRGNAYVTTMCTGNLRSATELLYRYHRTKDGDVGKLSLQYYGIILFFILGAAIGMVLTRILGEKAVILCCVLLLVVFFMMFEEVNDR